MLRRIIATSVIAFIVVGSIRADDQLKKEDLKTAIKDLAASVHKIIEQEKQESVAVGDFVGVQVPGANFGPGLSKQLSEELSALKVVVNEKANLTVIGRYVMVQDALDKKQKAMTLTVEVLNERNVTLDKASADVRDNSDIAKLTGVTVSLDANGNKKTRNAQIQDAKQNPTVVVQGSQIKAKADSPFSVELLVGGQGRAAAVEGGRAKVDIERDEVYAVRVSNTGDREAAVTLTIDGLDVFAFSDDIDPATKRPKFSHYIVPAKSSVIIKGWHKTADAKRTDNSLAFKVTEYAKSLHLSSKSSGEVGVLTVTFALSGVHPTDLPPEDAKSAQENGTTFGPPIQENQKPVQRIFGATRDVITVRYTR